MKTGAIIQARMNSSRLYGKVLKDLNGKTVLERVIDRVRLVGGLDEIVIATHDRIIAQHAANYDCQYFLTNTRQYTEDDVLSRFKEVVNFLDGRFKFDTIVRITSDCPLLDPEIAARVIHNFKTGGYDYYSNCRPKSTFPDGMDVEVFTYETLIRTAREAVGQEREHVTPYIWNHPQLFKVGRLVNPVDNSHHRLTLDTEEDLVYIQCVYRDLGNTPFGIDKILVLPYHRIRTPYVSKALTNTTTLC